MQWSVLMCNKVCYACVSICTKKSLFVSQQTCVLHPLPSYPSIIFPLLKRRNVERVMMESRFVHEKVKWKERNLNTKAKLHTLLSFFAI